MLKFSVLARILTFWPILAWALTLLTHRQQVSNKRFYWEFMGFIILIFWLDKRKNKKGRWKHSSVHTPQVPNQNGATVMSCWSFCASQSSWQSEASPSAPAIFPCWLPQPPMALAPVGQDPYSSPVPSLQADKPWYWPSACFAKVNLLFSNS